MIVAFKNNWCRSDSNAIYNAVYNYIPLYPTCVLVMYTILMMVVVFSEFHLCTADNDELYVLLINDFYEHWQTVLNDFWPS